MIINESSIFFKLKKAISPGPTMKPMAIASTNPKVGDMGYFVGWGYLSSRGPVSLTLQKAPTKVRDNNSCWGLPDGQLCAVIREGIGFCDVSN